VILYILLSGVPPFYGNSDNDILNMVRAGEFSFKIDEFKVVSSNAKDLITKMLTKPEVRLTSN
jgi:calcium-dependent protein kinase